MACACDDISYCRHLELKLMSRSRPHRSTAAAAIVLVFVLVPLRDVLAGARARSCPPASCCVAKGHACPMQHRDGPAGGCRMKSCGERDTALVQVPPAVAAPAAAHASPPVPAMAATSRDAVIADQAQAPPDPPPPRPFL